MLHCAEQNFFKNSFLREWNKLDQEIRRTDSYVDFQNKLFSFIKPTNNKTLSIYDPLGIKLLNRLRADFSHPNKHKFKHNFADTLNPFCSCSQKFLYFFGFIFLDFRYCLLEVC